MTDSCLNVDKIGCLKAVIDSHRRWWRAVEKEPVLKN